MFPKEIERIVTGLKFTKDEVGCSSDTVYLFEDQFVLKVSEEAGRLLREKERNDWITRFLPDRKVFVMFGKTTNIIICGLIYPGTV